MKSNWRKCTWFFEWKNNSRKNLTVRLACWKNIFNQFARDVPLSDFNLCIESLVFGQSEMNFWFWVFLAKSFCGTLNYHVASGISILGFWLQKVSRTIFTFSIVKLVLFYIFGWGLLACLFFAFVCLVFFRNFVPFVVWFPLFIQ